MFGLTSTGKMFVVINGRLVFQSGESFPVRRVTDSLEIMSAKCCMTIEKVCYAVGFNHAQRKFGEDAELLYDRRNT